MGAPECNDPAAKLGAVLKAFKLNENRRDHLVSQFHRAMRKAEEATRKLEMEFMINGFDTKCGFLPGTKLQYGIRAAAIRKEGEVPFFEIRFRLDLRENAIWVSTVFRSDEADTVEEREAEPYQVEVDFYEATLKLITEGATLAFSKDPG